MIIQSGPNQTAEMGQSIMRKSGFLYSSILLTHQRLLSRLTLGITVRASGIDGTMRISLRALRCMPLLGVVRSSSTHFSLRCRSLYISSPSFASILGSYCNEDIEYRASVGLCIYHSCKHTGSPCCSSSASPYRPGNILPAFFVHSYPG